MRTIGVVLLAAAAALGAAAQADAASCMPKMNVEAIVDDSSSMTWSDPADLRIAALDLLIDTQGNERRTLGAVEFGSDARPLFGPGPIGPNAAAFKATLPPALIDDGVATDYNDAFAVAAAHNPTATARIFLTDGEHTDAVPYANGHAGGPPVYVIGLGVGFVGSPFDALLSRIANQTHGLYRRADDAGELQAAMFALNSAIACQAKPKQFSDDFNGLRQAEAHTVTLPSRTRTVTFALTWSSGSDRFTIGGFRLLRDGRARKLKLTRRQGTTFTIVRVSGLASGKLRFTVRPTRLGKRGAEVGLTTQMTRPLR